MGISNELSSEIATAILSSNRKSPRELSDLKEIVLSVHSTLQKMTDEARAQRLKSLTLTPRQPDKD